MKPSGEDGREGFEERRFTWVGADGKFAKQMQASGITPQHRIAIAVSGGADSMALCLLAARWKRSSLDIAAGKCDGLLGFVVDHGLRSDSAEEAMRVQQWVANLGLSCDTLKCMWLDGVPAKGHLQESARNARYSVLAQACQRTGVQILLTAHHADDQAELFILRLSRCSGIAGLAGMASTTNLYPALSPRAMNGLVPSNLLLIRPLLKFVKEELYAICQKFGQEWIEDPTNINLSFARNRIRKALKEASFLAIRSEIQESIAFCRKIRNILDGDRGNLLSAVSEVSQKWGYVTVKVEKLLSNGVSSSTLHRTVASLIQFASQKLKPPRGRAVDKAIEHLRAKNSQGAFTVGGCNIFPAPGSKGSMAIICFSPDSMPPSVPSAFYLDQSPRSLSSDPFIRVPALSPARPRDPPADELTANSISKAICALTRNIKTPRTIVDEFNGLGLISDAGASLLTELALDVSLDMGKQAVTRIENTVTANWKSNSPECMKVPLCFGGSEHFMDRFVVSLSSRERELATQGAQPSVLESDSKRPPRDCCLLRHKMWIRHFEDKDWVDLSRIAKISEIPSACNPKPGDSQRKDLSSSDCNVPSKRSGQETKEHSGVLTATFNVDYSGAASNPSYGVINSLGRVDPCRRPCCQIERFSKAKEALAQLRNVPKLVRRGLPVIITAKGLLLGIPSVGYSHCQLASMKAIFYPRTPLGGEKAPWRKAEI